MMITDHARLGRLSSAFTLLTGNNLKIVERENKIIITTACYALCEEFTSEFDAIMWLHSALASFIHEEIAWFEQHREAFNGSSGDKKE